MGSIVATKTIYTTAWGDCRADELPSRLDARLRSLRLRKDGGFDMRFKAARELTQALDEIVMAKNETTH